MPTDLVLAIQAYAHGHYKLGYCRISEYHDVLKEVKSAWDKVKLLLEEEDLYEHRT